MKYKEINYPCEVQNQVDSFISSWKDFCAQSEQTKSVYKYQDGVGYENQTDSTGTRDAKELLHYTLASHEELRKQGFSDPLLERAQKLVEGLDAIVQQYLQEIEVEYSVDLQTDITSNQSWILRALHYYEGSVRGSQIAMPHVDKGGFTLHLYESDEGLEYLNQEYKWLPIDVSGGKTVIIPGLAAQYVTGNSVKGVYHRVVANEQVAREGRYSLVLFIDIPKMPKYNKDKHGRMQDKEIGFNYSLSQEELEVMFS